MAWDDDNQRILQRLWEIHLPKIRAASKEYRRENDFDANWPDTSASHPVIFGTKAYIISRDAQDAKKGNGYADQTPKIGLAALSEAIKNPAAPGALVEGLYPLRGFEVIAYDNTHLHTGELTDIFK